MNKKIYAKLVGLTIGAIVNAIIFSSIMFALNAINVAGINAFQFKKGVAYFFLILLAMGIINLLLLLLQNAIAYLVLTFATTPILMFVISMSGIEFHWFLALIVGSIISLGYFKFWWKTHLELVEKLPKEMVEYLTK